MLQCPFWLCVKPFFQQCLTTPVRLWFFTPVPVSGLMVLGTSAKPHHTICFHTSPVPAILPHASSSLSALHLIQCQDLQALGVSPKQRSLRSFVRLLTPELNRGFDGTLALSETMFQLRPFTSVSVASLDGAGDVYEVMSHQWYFTPV